MNDILKDAMYAGIGLAVVTREKMQVFVEDLIIKGKEYQGVEDWDEDEDDDMDEMDDVQDEMEEGAEEAPSRFEEIEHKLRGWVDNAVSRLGFMKNDENERIEERIDDLATKIEEIIKNTSKEETTEEVENETERS
ncbi:MAG: phasin family protein [Saprospiraceae bacterium]|nr:phasin family protein [Saprospiraceae bacterium]